MSSDKIFNYAASVSTRDEFITFVELLSSDYRQNAEEWQNNDLVSFLDGLSAFANDMSGYYENRKEVVDVEVVTWRMAAQMLLAATVYGN